VIDAKGTIAGILGSNNTLQARVKGTVGFVIDGVCRDSYEATIQNTPMFCTVRSPAHPMGRIRRFGRRADRVRRRRGAAGDLVVGDDDAWSWCRGTAGVVDAP
jgi:regulator of RNase E activity RraA